jgi:hypothetical protein
MDDHPDILRKQAEWQRAQADLSWAAKVRVAESVRESIAELRHRSPSPDGSPSTVRERNQMTARIVPLQSDEAGDGRVGGTAADRLSLLADVSSRMWELTKRPRPTYTRNLMPVKMTTLADQ